MITSEMTIAEIFKVMESKKVEEIDALGCWYDWFCKDSSLRNKGIALLKKLNSLKDSKKFDKTQTYVFFKNNCPCYGDGRLYDDFRICDKESGDVIFTIIPRDPYGKAAVYGRENGFDKPLAEGAWKDIKAFFLKPAVA